MENIMNSVISNGSNSSKGSVVSTPFIYIDQCSPSPVTSSRNPLSFSNPQVTNDSSVKQQHKKRRSSSLFQFNVVPVSSNDTETISWLPQDMFEWE